MSYNVAGAVVFQIPYLAQHANAVMRLKLFAKPARQSRETNRKK